MKFTASISRFGDSKVFWTSIIIIHDKFFLKMIILSYYKIIILSVIESITFHSGMLPKNQYHYFILSIKQIKTLNFDINDKFLVEIVPDKFKFIMQKFKVNKSFLLHLYKLFINNCLIKLFL